VNNTMVDQKQCEANQTVCTKLWGADIKRLEERFLFTDKALDIQRKEIERRMHESNDIKKEFSKTMSDLKIQVSTLEAKSALWLRMIGFGLATLQIIIGITLSVWK